ncbi:hypothetical protein [Pseudomonas aeruginosa]|uniref:hypothetical protein n=1 Tax=Pseudomonas aeruginosa TaxID=287 RepID=UPI001F1A092F|nr:hypothetical protein [Pseudomonas aeruginosa]MDG4275955.1 hypothetical protein [Pseudomonas aeruginosa]
MTKANECTCPSGDGSLRHPCPAHPASVELAGVGAKLTFINGRPAMCGCQVEYSSGGGEYSDVIYVTLCAKHSGSAILDLVATNRIALTPEYEGQWHADLYLDREIPLAKADGATPAEAVLALMSAERIDPEQESVEQAGGDERAAFRPAQVISYRPGMGEVTIYVAGRVPGYMNIGDTVYVSDRAPVEQPSAALAQPSPAQAEQAEAERPEAVAWQYRVTAGPQTGWSLWHPGKGEEFERSYTVERRPLMTVAQYDRIVGELRADRDSWAEQAEQRLADWDEMRKERDAALARVAELERQEPVALANRGLHAFWVKWTEAAAGLYGPGIKLYAAPVVQAQHSVPDELRAICMLVAETGIKYGRGRHRAVAADECRAVVNAVLNADLSVGRACEYAGCCDKAHPGTSLCIAHHSKKAREQLLAAAPGKEGV